MGSGTGLGLSQVYGFARQSGGLARMRSEEGQGTTVEMHLPGSADAEADGVDRAPAAPAVPAQAGARHILVVEDDADVRRVIVECLSLIGYTVTEAANGADGAGARWRAAKPDLLVVDYAMPDMTGAEVISEAREMVGDMPVILATGYADMAAVERLAGKPAHPAQALRHHDAGRRGGERARRARRSTRQRPPEAGLPSAAQELPETTP